MQITIPKEVEETLRNRALAAGFRTVDEYVLDLLTAESTSRVPAREALRQLTQLRREVPRMTSAEILDLVNEGRN